MKISEKAVFALALERIGGVGRVSAGKILRYFPGHATLTDYPREQVLTRLKGVPNARELLANLFDDAVMVPLLGDARQDAARLAERGIFVIAAGDAHWPDGLAALPAADRPNVLYGYGNAAALDGPLVALFGRDGLSEASFEYAQDLTGFLAGRRIHPVIGMASGFDVVIAKRSAPAPCVIVCDGGLAQIAGPMRPTVSAAVRAGSVLISSFAMHQPIYPHQHDDRALQMAAIASAGVFMDPEPASPAWNALEWMLEEGKPVFGRAADSAPLPARVHRLNAPIDSEWVATAAGVAATGEDEAPPQV